MLGLYAEYHGAVESHYYNFLQINSDAVLKSEIIIVQ